MTATDRTTSTTLSVNGAPRQVSSECTLDQLVDEFGAAPSGVAVAVNKSVVPRSEWPSTRLDEGDRVEILSAVQGG